MTAQKKVLVANRGEIAVRIIRTLRNQGYGSVAVYSSADAQAPHVRHADEAYEIGAAPANESYLIVDNLIAAAKKAGVWAIHPGYGFLSENPILARGCEREGIVFLGPSSKVIEAMGDKLRAREIARKVGAQMVESSLALTDAADALREAKRIGFPILLKAKAGGGGKGMRAVPSESELREAFGVASSEALKSFGDATMYLERWVVKPRHIEVQVFGDSVGNIISLGDRECSAQRRHQKIIEEAPAPRLSQKTKEAMADISRRISQEVGYVGAGTLEFLVDEKENFFFLEMNTRLQVEHPVTECITGLDLVAWQLMVAEGKPLPLRQDQVELRGHAMEVRVYAEDPDNQFFPSPGTIRRLSWPSGPGVRIDSGVEMGSVVSLYYDPLLAKVIAWNQTREGARLRLVHALEETILAGMKTNLIFLQDLLAHPSFVTSTLWTTFIEDHGSFEKTAPGQEEFAAALVAVYLEHRTSTSNQAASSETSSWWASGLPKRREVSP